MNDKHPTSPTVLTADELDELRLASARWNALTTLIRSATVLDAKGKEYTIRPSEPSDWNELTDMLDHIALNAAPPAGDAGLLREARNRIWNFHRERHFGEFNPSDCSTCLFLAQLNAALSATRPDAFGAAALVADRSVPSLSGDTSVADRKDAARYRWLRDQKTWPAFLYEAPELDAAIDAAMAASPDKGAAS